MQNISNRKIVRTDWMTIKSISEQQVDQLYQYFVYPQYAINEMRQSIKNISNNNQELNNKNNEIGLIKGNSYSLGVHCTYHITIRFLSKAYLPSF